MKKVLFVSSLVLALNSCRQEDNESLFGANKEVSVEQSQSNPILFSTLSGSFDEEYEIPLSNYYHKRQQTGYKCGATSYVVARKMINPSYPNEYSNINTIHNLLAPVNVYKLATYNDGTAKDFIGESAGNAEWGPKRDIMKNYIKNNLSLGRPVIVPTEYNLDQGVVGHFYIVVSLHLKNGGIGSVIGVKDVASTSSATKYFDYSSFLSSNWRNSSRLPGNRNYSAYTFN